MAVARPVSLTNVQVRIFSRPVNYKANVVLVNDFGSDDIYLCEHLHLDHATAVQCGETWLRTRLDTQDAK